MPVMPAQRLSLLPRKVAMPLSADTPAPVNTTTRCAAASSPAARVMASSRPAPVASVAAILVPTNRRSTDAPRSCAPG